MLKVIYFIILLLIPSQAVSAPVVYFDSVRHDFGEVKQSEKPRYVFTFSNAGNEDLIVEKVSAS